MLIPIKMHDPQVHIEEFTLDPAFFNFFEMMMNFNI